MKLLIASLLLFSTFCSQAKDYVIEDKFIVTLPDDTKATDRPDDSVFNIGYPKVYGPGIQFQTFWWVWVSSDMKLADVPSDWVEKMSLRKAYRSFHSLSPFTTDSGLEGVRFKASLSESDTPDKFNDMVLLRDQEGKTVLFQIFRADEGTTEKAFKSIRYK